jgi:hypothetical protein
MPITSKNYAVVIRSLETMDARIVQATAKGLDAAALAIVGVIQLKYLSGPKRVHPRRISGDLQKSINRRVDILPDGAVARIGSNSPYGAYHEFGFTGDVSVRGFNRGVRQAGKDPRRAIRSDTGELLGYKDTLREANRRRTYGPNREIFVRAHHRHVNYRGMPFVRPAVEENLEMIRDRVVKELKNV